MSQGINKLIFSTILLLCISSIEVFSADASFLNQKNDLPLNAGQIGINDYFLTQTRDGLVKISPTGVKETIVSGNEGRFVEVLGDEIYVSDATLGGNILVHDSDGTLLRTIFVPDEASDYLGAVLLPDKRVALLDNRADKVFFINANGDLLETVNMLNPATEVLQNTYGLAVDNKLIFVAGNEQIQQIDLTTYEISVFRDLFPSLGGLVLSDITYSDDYYYLIANNILYRFTDTSEPEEVIGLPASNGIGVVVNSNKAYVSTNFSGEIHEIDLLNKTSTVFVSGLNFPSDLELFIPEPKVQSNFVTGSKGSFFTISGQDFPENSQATLTANSTEIGTVTTDNLGRFSFILSTENADNGSYFVTVSVNPQATLQITISADEPLRAQSGTGTIIDVPPGIAITDDNLIYLPTVIR